MSLSQALMIATQSLGTISSQIGVVSRNISNAGVDDATKKSLLLRPAQMVASSLPGSGEKQMRRCFVNYSPPMLRAAQVREFRTRLIK